MRCVLRRLIHLHLLFLSALISISGFNASGQDCTPLPRGIVAWWRAENNFEDAISGKAGIVVGNETFTNGRVNSGFLGDGLGDGILITNTAPSQLQTLTIELWLRRGSTNQASLGTSGNAVLLGFGPGGYFFWMTSSGNISFNRHGDGAIFSSASIQDTNFHHLAVTVGAGQLAFYVDGALASFTLYNPSFTFSGGLGIGYRPDTADNSFLGVIDEVTIYNRALTAEEISAVYSAGAEGKCLTHQPMFLREPVSQSHFQGRSAIFSALATGNEPLTYQWTFNETNIAGATNNSLTLQNLQPAQSGLYAVTASNASGVTVSSNATLTVAVPDCLTPLSGIVAWWGGEANTEDLIGNLAGYLAGNETYSSGMTGLGFVGDGLGDAVLVTNATALQLTTFTFEAWVQRRSLSRVSFGGGGNAILAAFAPSGYSFYLNSSGQPNFVKSGDPTPIVSGTAINDLNFHHLVISLGGGLFRLYVDGVNVTTTSYAPNLSFSPTFGIGARPDNLDNSFLGVLDEVAMYNRVLSSTEIQSLYEAGSVGKCIDGPPVFVLQPTNQSVFQNTTANFYVVVGKSPSLKYQWTFNGTNISGATNSSLVLPAVQPSQMGNYSVVLSNAFGQVVSSNALLTVNPPPPCLPVLSGTVGWWRADNNASDFIGGKNGGMVGNETFAEGRVGIGFLGDGLGDGVLVTNSTSFQLQTLTIELWMRRTSTTQVSLGAGGTGALVGFGTGGYLFWLNSSGTLAFNRLGENALYSSATIQDTNFHHVAVTYGANQVNFYVDGNPAGTVSYASGFAFSGALGIGCRPDVVDNSFLGIIDEVTIYNRTLAAGEISAIYNTFVTGKCGAYPPSLIQQPASQSQFVGRSAFFSASAGGSEPMTYRWSFNGTNIASGSSSTLILQNLQLAQSGDYAVTASNAFGIATSSNATLTVTFPACLTPPPGLVAWWAAEANTLDSVGTANGTLVGNETYVAGATGTAFIGDGLGDGVLIPNPTPLQLSTFTLEAWVQRSSLTTVSFGGGNAGVLIGFGTGGYSFYLNSSGKLTFSKMGDQNLVASAEGIADLNFHHLAVSFGSGTVKMYIDGTNVTTTSYSPTFSFPSTFGIGIRADALDNSFFGKIDEVGIYNRVLSAAEIQSIFNAGSNGKCLDSAPTILTQPTNQIAFEGTPASFYVVAGKSPSLTYQWKFDGMDLAGATNSSLMLPTVQLAQTGNYSVAISNSYGFILSSNALLTVNPPPPCAPAPSGMVGWWRGESNALNVMNGQYASLTGNERYGSGRTGAGFWGDGFGDGLVVTNTAAFQLQTLTIELWLRRSSSQIVSFGGGSAGALVGFGNGGYLFWMNTSGTLAFNRVGNNATLSSATIQDTNFHHVAVTCSGSQVIFYLDGNVAGSAGFGAGFSFTTPLGIGFRGDNTDNSFLGVLDEVAIYSRVLSGAEIKSIYDASLAGKCYVPSQPQITQQPSNQNLFAGQTANLSVSAFGEFPMSFQWCVNGQALAGATNAAFSISNIQPHHAGNYSVIISNSFGSTTSSNAAVKVGIVSFTANGQSQSGSNAVFSGNVTLQFTNYYTNGYIFYTLDGSDPTPFSSFYSGPIVISNSVVLRTLAFNNGFTESAYSDPFFLTILPNFTLTTSTPGGGSISVNPSATGYLSNTLVTITAVASNGWTFLQWAGDASGNNRTNTVVLSRNKSVQAIFGTTIGKSSIGNGSIILDPPGTVFPYGYNLLVSAIPAPGNAFVLWGNAASGATNPLPFSVVSANPSISALFAGTPENQFSLAVIPLGDGNVNVTPRANIYSAGQSVTITANPDSGRTFLGWSGDASGTPNPLSLTMNGNKVVYANFSTDNRLLINLNGRTVANGVQLDLLGEIGLHYQFEASIDLSTWTALADMTNFTGSLRYFDLSPTNQLQKFYRAVILP